MNAVLPTQEQLQEMCRALTVNPQFQAMMRTARTGAGGTGGGGVGDWQPVDVSLEPLVDEAKAAVREADEAYEPGVTLEELEALGWVR